MTLKLLQLNLLTHSLIVMNVLQAHAYQEPFASMPVNTPTLTYDL